MIVDHHGPLFRKPICSGIHSLIGNGGEYMKKRRLKKKVKIAFIGLSAITLSFVGFIYLPNRLHEVTIEAGNDSELTEDQFIKTNDEGVFASDIETINHSIPGKYTVKVKIGFMTYQSNLIIIDTVKPALVLKEIVSPLNKSLKPEDFVEKAVDNTELAYQFTVAPDTTKIGVQNVEIKATDLGNNTTIESTSVLISQVKDKVTIEAGSVLPQIQDFLLKTKTNEEFVTNLKSMKLVVGTYPVVIKMEGRLLTSSLEVVDTVAPKGKALSIKAYVGDKVTAGDFVTGIVDASKVVVSFKENINLTSKDGTFTPVILLTDAAGNRSELTGKIVVIRDTIAPVISGSGLRDRSVFVGDSFSVKSQVYANDNRDGRVTLYISGSVNFDAVGTYPITFSAKDRAGNATSKKITITVKQHPPFVAKASTGSAELDQLIDGIYAKYLFADMSAYQITYTLYEYGRSIIYLANGDKPDVTQWNVYSIERAITSLKSKRGNCFGRAYVMKALFMRAGISNNIQVQYNYEHSWNQVNIGNGWQNVDVGFSIFLQSDAYLKSHALAIASIKDDLWDTVAPVIE
jgi:hypothetical protein